MKEILFGVREDETDGGFAAAALEHDIFTEGDTLAKLRVNVRAAVQCHFAMAFPGHFRRSFACILWGRSAGHVKVAAARPSIFWAAAGDTFSSRAGSRFSSIAACFSIAISAAPDGRRLYLCTGF